MQSIHPYVLFHDPLTARLAQDRTSKLPFGERAANR